MKARHYIPLVGFVVPTIVIGYGVVIPRSCIAGVNELTIGFAATAWRLGDVVFRQAPLARYQAAVPAPLVALIGATLLYLSWQLPAIGALVLAAVIAYALGAVVTARLAGMGGRGT